MILLVGLGNPEKKYENTRHNFGFLFIDELVRQFNLEGPKIKYQAEIYTGNIGGEKVIAVKPLTYMNRSGISVKDIKLFYKIPLENIVVFHDDVDISLGRIKAKIGGGAGGHNGLRSIDSMVGTNYHRVRLGVGRPSYKDFDTADYVLGKFAKPEREVVDKVNYTIASLIDKIIRKDFVGFLNEFAIKAKAWW